MIHQGSRRRAASKFRDAEILSRRLSPLQVHQACGEPLST
jgi:hypothetical protein